MTARSRDFRPTDRAAVQEIVFGVMREFGLTPDPEDTDADLSNVVDVYQASGGTFKVLETDDGRIVGCAGLCPLSDTEVELRKMYLLPEARGRGLGRGLLEELIAIAKQKGFERIRLETASPLKDARQLYVAHGFEEQPSSPHAKRCDRVMELDLTAKTADFRGQLPGKSTTTG